MKSEQQIREEKPDAPVLSPPQHWTAIQADAPSIIKDIAPSFKLDPVLILALCLHESKLDMYATRTEQGFFERRLAGKRRNELAGYVPRALPSLEDEKLYRATSFGWAQILGETARVLGYSENYLTGLCDPWVNIQYCCLYLRKLAGSNWVVESNFLNYSSLLLAYNGGGDKTYPAKVLAHTEEALTMYEQRERINLRDGVSTSEKNVL